MTRPVVFDCDGVLVDSESLAWAAVAEALAPFGIEVTAEDREVLSGRTFDDTYTHFVALADVPPPAELWGTVVRAMVARLERHLEAFEDAEDTLSVLVRRAIPMAAVASSPRERLDLALASTGLGAYFDVSVAGDEVGAGKPAPELFQAAARALGVDPTECVAVEDSPLGVSAAGAAGMYVVAVVRYQWGPDDLASADVVVPRLTPAPFL